MTGETNGGADRLTYVRHRRWTRLRRLTISPRTFLYRGAPNRVVASADRHAGAMPTSRRLVYRTAAALLKSSIDHGSRLSQRPVSCLCPARGGDSWQAEDKVSDRKH